MLCKFSSVSLHVASLSSERTNLPVQRECVERAGSLGQLTRSSRYAPRLLAWPLAVAERSQWSQYHPVRQPVMYLLGGMKLRTRTADCLCDHAAVQSDGGLEEPVTALPSDLKMVRV